MGSPGQRLASPPGRTLDRASPGRGDRLGFRPDRRRGGIFLSPILILCGWAGPKETAALSAAFIVLNSAAGLLGFLTRGGGLPLSFAGLLLLSALVGGAVGPLWGARQASPVLLRRLLVIVLLLAVWKLLA